MKIRLARPDDRERVVATIVAAFANDPIFQFFFDDSAGYDELAPVFAGYLFDVRVARGSVWTTDDSMAVALWDMPGAANEAPAEVARVATLRQAAEIALGASGGRIVSYDDLVEPALPEEPHAYLGILASHPSQRGKGLARHVASAGLEYAREHDLVAFLETGAPDNVRVYESAGWTIHAALPDVCGNPVWVMQSV